MKLIEDSFSPLFLLFDPSYNMIYTVPVQHVQDLHALKGSVRHVTDLNVSHLNVCQLIPHAALPVEEINVWALTVIVRAHAEQRVLTISVWEDLLVSLKRISLSPA